MMRRLAGRSAKVVFLCAVIIISLTAISRVDHIGVKMPGKAVDLVDNTENNEHSESMNVDFESSDNNVVTIAPDTNATNESEIQEILTNYQQLFKDKYDHTNFPLVATQHRFFSNLVRKADRLKNSPKIMQIISDAQDYLVPWLKTSTIRSVMNMPTHFKGRGIVMCIYDKYFPLGWHSILTIRKSFQSDIQIQVFHLGDEDLSPANQKILINLGGVTCHNIYDYFDRNSISFAGWSMKPFAALVSTFDQVILMDEDAVMLQKPELLFEYPIYKETGTLFFKDRTTGITTQRALNFVTSVLPSPLPAKFNSMRFFNDRGEHEMESGIVVISKSKRFLGLLTACWMNGPNESKDVTYKYLYGDKDTFWVGFGIIDEPFGFNVFYSGNLGVPENDNKICGRQMVHLDWKGEPMWVHNGIVEDKYRLNTTKVSTITHVVTEPGYWVIGVGCSACITGNEKPKEISNEILKIWKKHEQLWYDIMQNNKV